MPTDALPPLRAAALVLLLAFGCAAPVSALGGSPPSPDPRTGPTPVGETGIATHTVVLGGAPGQTSCTVIYDNTTAYTGLYYSDQDGAEVFDDLHTVSDGGLCAFTLGYNKPGGGSFEAVVTFYANTPQDIVPQNVVAGPFSVTGLPAGANAIRVVVPGAPFLPADIWMGVRFTSVAAGMLISDPPEIGFSHDFYYESPPGGYFYFGGNPRANFYMKVESELAVPVEPSTWGGLKSRHR